MNEYENSLNNVIKLIEKLMLKMSLHDIDQELIWLVSYVSDRIIQKYLERKVS